MGFTQGKWFEAGDEGYWRNMPTSSPPERNAKDADHEKVGKPEHNSPFDALTRKPSGMREADVANGENPDE